MEPLGSGPVGCGERGVGGASRDSTWRSELDPLARVGPEVGAATLYVLCLTLIARRVVLQMAKNAGLILSAGREAQSAACLSCGYPIGTEGPCPECGTVDPRAVPEGVYVGR